MNDAVILALARDAGLAVQWTDYAGKRHRVPFHAIRALLTALGLPCATSPDVKHSRQELQTVEPVPLIVAAEKQVILIPGRDKAMPRRARVVEENGTAYDVKLERTSRGVRLPPIGAAGYHQVDLGARQVTIAVAPGRCMTIDDVAGGERLWGPVAQVYGLRSSGDYGIGNFGAVAALAQAAAKAKADAIAISPIHALFTADPRHFSPYSPSSRLFFNPLHADPVAIFGEAPVSKARAVSGPAHQAAALIDWPKAARAKLNMFRALFEEFATSDLTVKRGNDLATDFANFCNAGGTALERHAVFEALHAAWLRDDPKTWSWRDWPREWQRPDSPAVTDFAQRHQREIDFQLFLQWITDRSLAAAQHSTRSAGMRIGLIADLAVGISRGGSQAWAYPQEILDGVEIGAPPDLFNAQGQSWGLTTFAPRALRRSGYRGFIDTLRACMRHAGGVRIDHAMGLMRLWLVPVGAKASEGAYLSYPLTDLLRLLALESYRHRALVVGEDLGTVPPRFRDELWHAGIYGMAVLWFERGRMSFTPPGSWRRRAVAMTSTHDLPTVAGWWQGSDLTTRAKLGILTSDKERARRERQHERRLLWKAFTSAKVESGSEPPPRQIGRVTDAAVKYIAKTPCPLALVPLEDVLGSAPQPNLPGTIDDHPNWRRRYPGEAKGLLNSRSVRKRIVPLANRGRR